MVAASVFNQALVDICTGVVGLLDIARVTLARWAALGVQGTAVVTLCLLCWGARLPAGLSAWKALWHPAYPLVLGAVQLLGCRVEKVALVALVGHLRVELSWHGWVPYAIVIPPARLSGYIVFVSFYFKKTDSILTVDFTILF